MIRTALRDAAAYMVPTLLSRGLSVFLVPIYARALSPEDFGVLDLIMTSGAIINVLLTLEVAQGLVRLRVDVDEEERCRMTGTAWVFSVGIHAVFITVVVPLAPWIAETTLGGRDWADAVRVGAVAITLTCLVNLFLGQFRWELRSKAYSATTSVYAVSTIAVCAWVALGLDLGLIGILLGQSLTAVVTSVVTLFMVRDSWLLSFDARQLRSMLRFSWPLIPSSLSVFTSLYFNRMALTMFADLREVGLYGMGARLASFATLLIAGMQGAVTPLVYRHYRDSETPASLGKLFNIAVALAMVTGLGLHLVSYELVELLATPEYRPSAKLVPILAPAMLMAQMYVFAPGLAITQKTVTQLWVTVLGAVVSVAANVALVPVFGAMGAALATFGSAAVFLTVWIMVSQRHYPIPLNAAALALGVLTYATFTFAAQVLVDSNLPPLGQWAGKGALMTCFLVSLVAVRLLPLADLRQLARYLRGRKASPERD